MSKKSDQLEERERIINKIGDALEKLVEAIQNEQFNNFPKMYKYSKAHQQILDQALKFHKGLVEFFFKPERYAFCNIFDFLRTVLSSD